MLGLFTTLQNIETMRKLLLFVKNLFVGYIGVWKFYTVKEFFDNGGYIYTLMPDSKRGGMFLSEYCKYLSYESFVRDYPEGHWMVGKYTKYVIDNEDANYEAVPEPGFACRRKKAIPRYANVALAITVIGLLINIVTMFCISVAAGFISTGLVFTIIGATMYFISNKTIVSIEK